MGNTHPAFANGGRHELRIGTPAWEKTMITRRGMLGGVVLGGAVAVGGGGAESKEAAATLNAGLKGFLTGLHDPVMIRQGDTYHVFGSGGWWGKPGPSWRTSRDLATWVDNDQPFGVPAWAKAAIPKGDNVWAPDIAYVDGRYRLYYSVSTGGAMRSVTGYASTRTLDRAAPDYGWTDHGLVIESREGGDYNVIDANFLRDAGGRDWLSFGSYWSGLKLVELDRTTGKPRPGAPLRSIAYRPAPTGGDNPIEGAFLFARGGWYYLFASYDYCCKGLQSNYYTAVGRSRDVGGPYLARDGKRMMDGYGTSVLVERPWASTRWRGPGHCGLYRDGARDLIVYHAYDAEKNAAPTLRIAELRWDPEGWPTALT